jgi:hypothetical protein
VYLDSWGRTGFLGRFIIINLTGHYFVDVVVVFSQPCSIRGVYQ